MFYNNCSLCHFFKSASTDNGLQIHVHSLHPEKCDVEAAESSQRETTNLTMIGGMDVGRHSEKLVKCSVCQKVFNLKFVYHFIMDDFFLNVYFIV